eukprot:GHRR01012700.1.p1 GENE.GHRR01012700.1~~GHRR01012700.1.p1  ORF type:complete len:206 (+),score=49.96 GHRR01012700.1:782-1399(+)
MVDDGKQITQLVCCIVPIVCHAHAAEASVLLTSTVSMLKLAVPVLLVFGRHLSCLFKLPLSPQHCSTLSPKHCICRTDLNSCMLLAMASKLWSSWLGCTPSPEHHTSSLGSMIIVLSNITWLTGTMLCRYDGALGIILGISAVKAVLLEALYRAGKLQQQLQHWKLPNDGAAAADIVLSIEMVKGLLPGAVRVVAFCDEEGMRFK